MAFSTHTVSFVPDWLCTKRLAYQRGAHQFGFFTFIPGDAPQFQLTNAALSALQVSSVSSNLSNEASQPAHVIGPAGGGGTSVLPSGFPVKALNNLVTLTSSGAGTGCQRQQQGTGATAQPLPASAVLMFSRRCFPLRCAVV